eukprot:5021778-Pleurochrysis_carterae.AAC.2
MYEPTRMNAYARPYARTEMHVHLCTRTCGSIDTHAHTLTLSQMLSPSLSTAAAPGACNVDRG